MAEHKLQGEEAVDSWRTQLSNEPKWRDFVRLAWDISPVLAVRMASRLRFATGIDRFVKEFKKKI